MRASAKPHHGSRADARLALYSSRRWWGAPTSVEASVRHCLQLAKRNSSTSASCTTYSFPSSRILPLSLAPFSPPHSMKSWKAMVSARMNPFSKSEWMTPAAWGAVNPWRMVHALVSFSPVVKYVCRPSVRYAACTRAFRPPSSTPSADRYSTLSAASRSTSSASTRADTTTTSHRSSEALAFSAFTCRLSAPWLAKSSSGTFAA